MKLDLTGRQIEITEAIEEFVEKKVQKLSRYFDENTIVHVTFSARKDKQNVDIRIEYRSRTYMAELETNDIYYGIEEVIEKIEGQIRRDKTKMEKSRREGLVETEIEENLEEQ